MDSCVIGPNGMILKVLRNITFQKKLVKDLIHPNMNSNVIDHN
jgi:hypothetical protein